MNTEHLTLCEAIHAGTPVRELAKRKDEETIQFLKRQLHPMPLPVQKEKTSIKKLLHKKIFQIGGNRYYIVQCSVCEVDIFRKVITQKAVCTACTQQYKNKQNREIYKTKNKMIYGTTS